MRRPSPAPEKRRRPFWCANSLSSTYSKYVEGALSEEVTFSGAGEKAESSLDLPGVCEHQAAGRASRSEHDSEFLDFSMLRLPEFTLEIITEFTSGRSESAFRQPSVMGAALVTPGATKAKRVPILRRPLGGGANACHAALCLTWIGRLFSS